MQVQNLSFLWILSVNSFSLNEQQKDMVAYDADSMDQSGGKLDSPKNTRLFVTKKYCEIEGKREISDSQKSCDEERKESKRCTVE